MEVSWKDAKAETNCLDVRPALPGCYRNKIWHCKFSWLGQAI